MPTYSFSGSHESTHRHLSGRLEAKDEESARRQLARRSIKVESLEEIALLEAPSNVAEVAGLAGQRPPRVPLNLTSIAVTMMFVGLAWLGGTIKAQESGVDSAESQKIHLQVSGQIQALVGSDPASLEMRLHFPDVPLDLSRSGKELALDSQGRFRIEQDLKLRVKPQRVWVSFRAPGCRPVDFENLPLENFVCQIPPVTFQSAPAQTGGRR